MSEKKINNTTIPENIDENVSSIEELKDKSEKSQIKRKLNDPIVSCTQVVKKNIGDFSLDALGKIELAKKHSIANRPLHKLEDDFSYDIEFCRCCDLPCMKKGILEPFHFCDNIDMFTDTGLGVTLYFYFFQFMTLIVFLGIIILSIIMIIFNTIYTDRIIYTCNYYYKNIIKNTDNLDYCQGFINNQENINLFRRFIRWHLRLSSDHIEIYIKLPEKLSKK